MIMAIDLERIYESSPSEEALEQRAVARRAAHQEEIRVKKEKSQARREKAKKASAKALTALAVTGTLAAVGLVGEKLKNDNSLQEKARTYEGKYKIPSDDEPHRALFVDEEKIVRIKKGNSTNTAALKLHTVSQIANYVYIENPKIGEDEAIDLVEAENYQDQVAAGIPEDKIDPTLLHPGQEIRLPLAYGVGEVIVPEK